MEDFTGSMKNHLFSGEYQEPLNVDRYIDNGVCDMRINDLIAVIKGNNNSGYFCYAGITRFSIFPNGNIFPCQIYCLDKEDKFVMGNVNTFDEGYFNRKVNEISHMASKNSHEECKNCFSTSICSSCLGVCIVNQKRIPHEIEYCEKTKLYHEQLIEIYANLLSNPQRFEKFKKRLNETVALCKN